MTEQEMADLINRARTLANNGAARAQFEAECTEECPRCHKLTLHSTQVMNALCRRDNETYICSPCGTEQAFEDFAKVMK